MHYQVQWKWLEMSLSHMKRLLDQKTEKWPVAMESEMESLRKNNTWILVERPSDKKGGRL